MEKNPLRFVFEGVLMEFRILLGAYDANQNAVEIVELESVENPIPTVSYTVLSIALLNHLQARQEVFVKTYTYNAPIVKFIKENNYFGLFKNTSQKIQVGNFDSAIVEIWKLTALALKHSKRRQSS